MTPVLIAGLRGSRASVSRINESSGAPTVGPPLLCSGPSLGSSGATVVPFCVVAFVNPVLPLPAPLMPIRLPPLSVKVPAGLLGSGPAEARSSSR
jgi:hypothetical protein